MKKLLLFISLIPASLFAQITLEHTYDSTSNFAIIKYALVDSAEGKYIRYYYRENTIEIYNLDHSVYKIVTAAVPSNTYIENVAYFTRHLFDADEPIEFLATTLVSDDNGSHNATYVLNEQGSVLFFRDSSVPNSSELPNAENEIRAVFPTPDGAKMILLAKGKSFVYALPGKFPDGYTAAVGEDVTIAQGGSPLRAYPNPSNGQLRIAYTLPVGVTFGELVITTLGGSEVRRYHVGSLFDDLLIEKNTLPLGTYHYYLRTPQGRSAAQKLIVIE